MLILAVAACTGAGTDDETPADPCAGAPTWDDFARGYVATWCTACHSASLTGDDRQGAPPGIDLDTWSQVHGLRAPIAAIATGPDPAMPPLGGVPEDDVARFARWLSCGAEGSDEPPGPCDTLTVAPVATVSTDEDAAALCAAGNAVANLVVDGDVAIDCLCEVEGDLAVGGKVDLPLLERVGGLLNAARGLEELRAPRLAEVGGDAVFVEEPVAELDLSGLATVGGLLSLSDLPQLRSVSLDALYSVGEDLIVARDPQLASLDLPRLRTVGGRLELDDLPALVDLLGTRSIEAVGADLELQRLDALPVLDDWAFLRLETVGGDLVVRDAAALTAIHGLTLVADVGGDVLLEDLPAMVRIEGFDNLAHVAGDLAIRRAAGLASVNGLIALADVDGALVLEDLPALATFPGLEESLATTGGLRLVRIGASALPAFDLLTAIDGELRIEDLDALGRIDGFGALGAVGALTIASNGALAGITGLDALATVDGDVAVTGNPALSQAAVDAWLAGIAVGGTVTASGNAP